jgi:hypothetical protein
VRLERACQFAYGAILGVVWGVMVMGCLVGCGDNEDKAITIGVDVGRTVCVEVDAGSIREVACDAGTND